MSIAHPNHSEPRLITSRLIEDQRGWFTEVYSCDQSDPGGELAGIRFVQDNVSLSRQAGTVRGLHFQLPPSAQDKLVTVLSGSIFDVAVDIRRSSRHFGKYQTAELRAGTGRSFFVPAGFAHGFMTLEPDTLVYYKVSSRYAPALERGIAWDDPRVAIAWPLPGSNGGEVIISDRDRALPRLDDAKDLLP